MGEDQGGADDVYDLARAGGDMMEGTPAAGEQGEPVLAQAASAAVLFQRLPVRSGVCMSVNAFLGRETRDWRRQAPR